MIDYQVTMTDEGFVIQGNFPSNLTPIALPANYIHKKRFLSYFLHKNDVERAVSYLECISNDKHHFVNEGLFVAALTIFIKCFGTGVRERVSDDIYDTPDTKDSYNQFKDVRDKHFVHDVNGMTQTTDFMLVNLDEANPHIHNASVIYNIATFNYRYEANKLIHLMQILHNYLCREIDKMSDDIINEFKSKSKDELISYGSPNIRLANIDDVSKRR